MLSSALAKLSFRISSTRTSWRAIVLFVVASISILAALTLFGTFTGDDTYIHLVFARSIAAGQGFAFNPQEPTYGASSPLWVGLLAAVSLITHDFYWTARILSLVFSVLAVISVFLFAYRVTSWDWLSVCVAFVFAIDPHFLKFTFSGMETSLAISLVMLGLYLHMRTWRNTEEAQGFRLWFKVWQHWLGPSVCCSSWVVFSTVCAGFRHPSGVPWLCKCLASTC